MEIKTIWRFYFFTEYLINVYHEYLNTVLDIDSFQRLGRKDEQNSSQWVIK